VYRHQPDDQSLFLHGTASLKHMETFIDAGLDTAAVGGIPMLGEIKR
jgi:hypothetical protein